MAIKNPFNRKIVYSVLIGIDLLASITRPFIFPDQNWVFHITLFLVAFILFVVIWELMFLTGNILENVFSLGVKSVLRIIVQVILTFFYTYLVGYLIFSFVESFFCIVTPSAIDAIMPLLYLLGAIIFNLIYFTVYYFTEWKANLFNTKRLQREQTEVRYDALRNQLNPHFLFNALTSLNSLIFENQQLASDFLQQLSKVYRYTLQNKVNETVSLKTELEFISSYISLFKIRFQEAIIFSINISEESMEKEIAAVTLQMLVENAVKHNIVNITTPLTISISTNDDYLIVENTINKKIQVESSNKQGLENIKALYHYLSDKPIEIIDNGKTFKVKIPLI
jgi:sensor histidine kinase YesM